jgi:transcriptional regulator with XRE-family HTH domain
MTALHSQPYKDVIERVIARRLELGWSQEELARRLPRYEKPSGDGPPRDETSPEASGQLQSFVSKFEQRQRRLDVIEFMHLCHALGLRLCDVLGEHGDNAWSGEPPPTLVPLARETLLEERPLALRRARVAKSGGPRSVEEGSSWRPAPPLGGASHASETSEIVAAPLAAEAPAGPGTPHGRSGRRGLRKGGASAP